MKHRWGVLAVVSGLTMLVLGVADASTVVEFDRAARLAMLGDYDGALREYESFLARAPRDRLAPVAAAAVASINLEVRQDTAAAITSLDRILSDYRESSWAPDAARQKATCAEARQDWLKAGEAYEQAFDLALERGDAASEDWMNQVTFSAANSYHRAGNPSKVIQTYEKVLAGSPPPEVAASAHYRLGESLESAGETQQAAERYVRVIEEYPSSQLLERAVAKRELIEQHVNMNWTPIEKFTEGSVQIRQGDLAGALRTCDEALSASPGAPLRECLEYRKISLETAQSGDYTEGCGRLERFIAEHPNGLRTEIAERTLEQNWRPVARLEASARENPEDSGTLRALGQSYLQVRATSKGIETLTRALALAPDDPATHLTLGFGYAQAQRHQEAVDAFTFYLDRNPNDVNSLNMIGYMYLGMGDPEKALPYFERYAEIAPDEANAHDSLGEGYLEAGRLEDSAREYEEAIRIDPSFSNSYLMLGRVYRRMEKTDKAAGAYRRFIELIPSGPQADEAVAALEELGAR